MQEWSAEAYWVKAVKYFETAFNQDQNSSLFPLCASFALEFLGKAALAKIHPVLVADPRGEGRDILYAFGVDHKSPMTIQAKTVFNRLGLLINEFSSDDENICLLMADRRNVEVHSGASAYDDFPNGKWLPDLFRVVIVLVGHLGRDLEELLGQEIADEARAAAEGLAEKVVSEVKKRIADAKKGLHGLRPEELEGRRKSSDDAWEKTRIPGKLLISANCPSCDSKGRLGMVHVRDKPAQISDDNDITMSEIYSPRSYECKVCGLTLEGVRELKIVDLADQREFEYSQSPSEFFLIEHDYGASGMEYEGPEYDNE